MGSSYYLPSAIEVLDDNVSGTYTYTMDIVAYQRLSKHRPSRCDVLGHGPRIGDTSDEGVVDE